MAEGQLPTDSATISLENGKSPDVSFMADYLNERIFGPANRVPIITFSDKTGKQNHVLNAAETLFRISRECSKPFSKRFYIFALVGF